MKLREITQSRLPMDKVSRMGRARQMGFDTGTIWYHGTVPSAYVPDIDIKAFDPDKIGGRFGADEEGFFFTTDTTEASDYASIDGGSPEGGAVYPVYLKMIKPLIIDSKFLQKERISLFENPVAFWDNNQSLILDWYDHAKADGIILVSTTRGRNMGVVFNPNQIRSVNATFDPSKAKSSNLTEDYLL